MFGNPTSKLGKLNDKQGTPLGTNRWLGSKVAKTHLSGGITYPYINKNDEYRNLLEDPL